MLLCIITLSAVSSYAQVAGKSLQVLRQVGRIPETFTSISAALPMDLQSMLMRKAVSGQMKTHVTSIQTFQAIQNLSLPQIWEFGGKNTKYSLLEDKPLNLDPLLARLPNHNVRIPVEGISLNPMYEDPTMQALWGNLSKARNIGPQKVLLALSACKKIDQFLFTEKDGQVFINVPVLRHFHSYGPALEGLARTVNSYLEYPLFTDPVKQFIMLRNQQIVSSLENYLDATRDITTQRTAEEIKHLLENLDPENPLRISVEGALRTSAKEGYIRPVTNSEN